MLHSRRQFLKAGTAATAGLVTTSLASARPKTSADNSVSGEIVSLFDDLPGVTALKILAPASDRKPGFAAQLNPGRRLFAASAIKTFVLCEALRQADAPNIDEVLEAKELTLDSSVWALGSPIYSPPDLSGIVSERSTLEAMITRVLASSAPPTVVH